MIICHCVPCAQLSVVPVILCRVVLKPLCLQIVYVAVTVRIHRITVVLCCATAAGFLLGKSSRVTPCDCQGKARQIYL